MSTKIEATIIMIVMEIALTMRFFNLMPVINLFKTIQNLTSPSLLSVTSFPLFLLQ